MRLCENCISILCGVYVCVYFLCARACVHVCVKKMQICVWSHVWVTQRIHVYLFLTQLSQLWY